jgi:hypothetical protein
MALRKRESKLFVRLRKHLKNIHFTRIESSTIQGIPDVHGCGNGVSFWIELKSTDDSFPKLSKFQQSWCFEYARHGGRVFILHQTLSQRALKLYRVVGSQQPSSQLQRQPGRIWVKLSFLVECSVFLANEHRPLKHQDLLAAHSTFSFEERNRKITKQYKASGPAAGRG